MILIQIVRGFSFPISHNSFLSICPSHLSGYLIFWDGAHFSAFLPFSQIYVIQMYQFSLGSPLATTAGHWQSIIPMLYACWESWEVVKQTEDCVFLAYITSSDNFMSCVLSIVHTGGCCLQNAPVKLEYVHYSPKFKCKRWI